MICRVKIRPQNSITANPLFMRFYKNFTFGLYMTHFIPQLIFILPWVDLTFSTAFPVENVENSLFLTGKLFPATENG